ncbi:hypothetical protein [Puniceicoccus vermicola]|uniref:Lipid A biosynthesis acyltransferase n=1 Tax=Puniceicoccus vermicola TaxID=388746 RepID=A0A7X1AW14_9BACT|nr:hypothetical protein [Puniceicoccus vermicola]MBC2601046.1 hypothetical protein [Puniceicoccus vermicola]
MAVKSTTTQDRNPGPAGGFRLILFFRRWLPYPIFRLIVLIGTWIAVATLENQRKGSRAYLAMVLDRPPTLRDVYRHFLNFADTLIAVLRTGQGYPHKIRWAEGHGEEFESILRKQPSVLFGTFHLGHSDLLGYHLGNFGIRVSMVRIRVENSTDTELAAKQFGQSLDFIWVDDPQNVSFAVKSALEEGGSLAIKCDRIEGARKVEKFQFLGKETTFPFTIYYFSRLFERPVLFAFGVPDGSGGSLSYCAPPFYPNAEDSKSQHLARSREHFQDVLLAAEELIREQPFIWHNFHPDEGAYAHV